MKPFRYLLLVFFAPTLVFSQPVAREGVIDLRKADFSKGPISISGEWEFFMSELVPPKDIASRSDRDFIEFPSVWNDVSKSLEPGNGYATYRVKVLITPQDLSIELPHFYSNYKLWINGTEVASNGKVGTTRETSVPQWMPKAILYTASDDTLDIVIHASNFHHAMGGVREPIVFAAPEELMMKQDIGMTGNMVLASALGLTSFVFFFIYLFIKGDRAALYFAGLCLTWSARALFSNLYTFTYFVPEMPWEIAVKIEYFTLYFAMLFAILFLSRIFPNEVNSIFKYVMCICNLGFALVTIFFDASVYTQFLPVYLSLAGVLLIYITYVLIRALIHERQSAWLMVSCLFLGVLIFAYDIVAYEGFVSSLDPIIISGGYLVIFILMGMSLLYQMGFLKRSSGQHNMLTYEELYGKDTNKRRV